MNKTAVFHYKGMDCELIKGRYDNGRIGLEVIDAKDGEPLFTATVNLPDIELASDEVVIKNYSENEGLLEVLVAYNYVIPTGQVVETGYVSVPICQLLI